MNNFKKIVLAWFVKIFGHDKVKGVTKVFHLLGAVILIYILSTLQYSRIFYILKEINFFYLFLHMFSFFIYFFLKVYRFYFILDRYSHKASFFTVFGATIEAQYFGFVTPSRIGESIKIVFLEAKAGIPKKISLMTYVYDRFQDLYFMSLLGLLGFIFILKLPINKYLLVFAVCMLIVFLVKNLILKRIAKKFKIDKFSILSLKSDFYLFFQNNLIFLFFFLEFYFSALSLGVDIDFFYLSAVAVLGSLSTLIPISVSGLGIREGIFIYYLVKIGVSKESAFLISFLDNFGFLIIFVLILHLVYKIMLKIFAKWVSEHKVKTNA